jgi:hypothetical protein
MNPGRADLKVREKCQVDFNLPDGESPLPLNLQSHVIFHVANTEAVPNSKYPCIRIVHASNNPEELNQQALALQATYP